MSNTVFRMFRWAGLASGLFLVVGCKDLSSNQLPAGTSDPAIYNNVTGAIGLRNAAVYQVVTSLADYVVESGLLTDELQDLRTGASPGTLAQASTLQNVLDERLLPNGTTIGRSYNHLQDVRAKVNIALAALAKYDTATADRADQRAMRSELFVLEGYAEILLADLYCSGVPLSTLDFNGDFTYQPSSTTAGVYRDALSKLDSALALNATADSVANLAHVLRGRAYLNLGLYDSAVAAVAGVPTTFHYTLNIGWPGDISNWLNHIATVSDSEGQNGLPFRSSGDPRTAVTVVCTPTGPTVLYDPLYCPVDTLTFPTKYYSALTNATGRAPFPLADGIEARLIEAEASLHAGDATWLSRLNDLRLGALVDAPPDTLIDTLGVTGCDQATANCGYNPGDGLGGSTPEFGQPAGYPPAGYVLVSTAVTYPAPPGIQDYCYNASWYVPCYQGDSMVVATYVLPAHTDRSGGVAGLTALSDPGDSPGNAARLRLLFRERAFWLFLTGHRQGDLRRELRLYPQVWVDQSDAYPTGVYTAPGTGLYGADVTVPIPPSETANPAFHGCLDRNP
jgi:hypothetical protein